MIGLARHGFAEARRALAVAIAEREREGRRLARLGERAADLEARAVMALRAGRADLAEAAARTIASIEAEQVAARAVEQRFTQDVTRLRASVEHQRRRLADLNRGRRQAAVNAALARVAGVDIAGESTIGAAETLLEAITLDQSCDRALVDLDDGDGDRLRDTMAEAGFGAPIHPLASDVMRRLEARAALLSPPESRALGQDPRDDALSH